MGYSNHLYISSSIIQKSLCATILCRLLRVCSVLSPAPRGTFLSRPLSLTSILGQASIPEFIICSVPGIRRERLESGPCYSGWLARLVPCSVAFFKELHIQISMAFTDVQAVSNRFQRSQPLAMREA